MGNVLAVVTDKKIGHSSNGSSLDYSYRYGFNGKENDGDVKGDGNRIDYGARVYDPRLGRFLSKDPLSNESPEFTIYGYAYNNPIVLIDVMGLKGDRPGFEVKCARRIIKD